MPGVVPCRATRVVPRPAWPTVVLILLLSATGIARAAEGPVLVYAAASTRDAVDAAITDYRTRHPVQIHGVYASSSALARQILDGAPAALYLSANVAWMEVVASRDLLAERRDFLRNRLVLVAPADHHLPRQFADAADIAELLGDSRLAVAETTGVPAGIYARAALETLGIWGGLRSRLAEMSNVRGALFMVERGEAPLGLVYTTDALASSGVRTVWTVPEDAYPPVIYQLALMKAAADAGHAEAFFRFLLSSAGRRFFTERGFGTRD